MCSRTIATLLFITIFVNFFTDSYSAELLELKKDTAHKPIFTNCTNYAPTVKEEQPRGTYVMTVNALDEDPPEFGGTISYSIVKRVDGGSRNYFSIDNKTGEIKTAQNIDRDEPNQQKEFYITVKAADNGIPTLEDICTFKITVLDINDNYPQFDKSSYDEKVSEDLKIDSEVMRVFAYDTDDGDNAKLTYSMMEESGHAEEYFRIDKDTGVIYLKKLLTGKTGQTFRMQVDVNDNALEDRKSAHTEVIVTVIGSDKQPPSFIQYPHETIELYENHTILDQPRIAHFIARSNIEKQKLQFELPRGLTKQTNSESTFQIQQGKDDTEADLILQAQLDYEKVTDYSLTVRVTNADSLTAVITVNIKIKDVNDEIPTYIDVVSGSVLENDQPGAEVMQVRAIDKDGTEPNNLVTYEFDTSNAEVLEKFSIDPNTGKVTTKVSFDRELEDVYYLKITAKDGAPSALSSSGEPNKATQAFTVKIQDRNDNEPQFTDSLYVVDNIVENSDIGKVIYEIKALDKDIASIITYSIVDGNIDNAFDIESKTGRILVKNRLDYEKIKQYNLTVKAYDGLFSAMAQVVIKISNVNDELPIFEPYNKEIHIQEEQIYEKCIINLKAYDPDITDRNADQMIDYQVGDTRKEYFKVSKDGCVTVIKPLDRDPPNGIEKWQVFILAFDSGGASQSAELSIFLTDINDNAPFLVTKEVVWNENQDPDLITKLEAQDYDTHPFGGPPFKFKLAHNASQDIMNKFRVTEEGLLYADTTFNREEIKYYIIPVEIADQGDPSMVGISDLKVIIGDVNDNDAKDGYSEIFVYNYKGMFDHVHIGRVYVTDPDDWDLPDKVFQWAPESDPHPNFELDDKDPGMIIMKQGAAGNYTFVFDVTENRNNHVKATVFVNVKEIPEEAVYKSGSMRLQGATIDDFAEKVSGSSKKDLLQEYISSVLNTSLENVDVFTVLPAEGAVDVRFSAHGSPYYYSERLNSLATENAKQLEQELRLNFNMIGINECMKEDVCSSDCSSLLKVDNFAPSVVFTNKSSFVGVKAVVERDCACVAPTPVCYGETIEGTQCVCQEGQEYGPYCEVLGIGFNGDGWALYPSFQACSNVEITLEVTTAAEEGLIFYIGPEDSYPAPLVSDFMALEVRNGYLTLLVNYGSGTRKLQMDKKINDRKPHFVKIMYSSTEFGMWLDHCSLSNCLYFESPIGPNKLLNVNGPLQVGGIKGNIEELAQLLKWTETPTIEGLQGCVRNFTFNKFTYNLGLPGNAHNAFPNCQQRLAEAVSFSIDGNFLVAILVCVAILVILLLAVVVHRRKQDSWHEKDADDIRETIISYEDEGGGEVDTGYDLSVLQKIKENDVPSKEKLYKSSEVPDIRGFLNTKKNTCDRDPNNYPFDDVRYYAYEGDGNSSGSLSSLASCTDDGDLKFNYLSSFGPRFRKLADMYGEQPSDDDSAGGGEESWC